MRSSNFPNLSSNTTAILTWAHKQIRNLPKKACAFPLSSEGVEFANARHRQNFSSIYIKSPKKTHLNYKKWLIEML